MGQIEKTPVLVVDLDGTLLRTDMLYETFWSSLGSSWSGPIGIATAVIGGRASLKRHLARTTRFEAATLPYNGDVLTYIEGWRAKGGHTALVTGSDHSIAEAIAKYLGIFDEVRGSDGRLNLKGERKAEFLNDRFGDSGYAYIGDSSADVPVWQHAAKAITVNAPTTLRSRAEKVAHDIEHLTTFSLSFKPYLKSLRPHQWLKNVLIFLPMLAAHKLDGITFITSLLAFLAFCLIASSVYLLNDLLDLAADRSHPRKKNRPLASGSIPIAHGTWMALGLFLSGAATSVTLGSNFFLVMLGYYGLTTAYSVNLKRRIVIDICVLAGLYTMRIVAGGVATGIPLSVWLLAFSIFFFLSLAAVKRQAELIEGEERGSFKAAGRGYHVDDLPIISMMAIGAGYVSVLIFALYVNSPEVLKLYSTPAVLWGACCVILYWITRMVMVAHRGYMHYDPVVYAVKDPVSLACALVILAFAVAGAAI